MLILILTADVDADGFYGFGIKGVGWSAFSRDLDWHFRICCFYTRLDRVDSVSLILFILHGDDGQALDAFA